MKSLPWDSCPVFVWPSLSVEPTLMFEPVPEAASPQGSSGQSPSFPCCGHSRCLESHSLHEHHPKNCWGHHIFCKAPLFSGKMPLAPVLLPADFPCTRSWAGLTLQLFPWLIAGSDEFREGCRSWNPHTAPGRGRNTHGCVQLWCY